MQRKFVLPGLIVVMLAACAAEPPKPIAVFFWNDHEELTPEGRHLVADIALQAKQMHVSRIEIEGHADGATDDRSALAQARADSVAHGLVEEGISPNLIQAHAGMPNNGETDVAARKALVTLIP